MTNLGFCVKKIHTNRIQWFASPLSIYNWVVKERYSVFRLYLSKAGSLSTCLEHSTGEQVTWKQLSVITGCTRSRPEHLKRPQARRGRGWPQSKTACLNAHSQGIFWISSPADQKITRRFTESGAITACKPDQRPIPWAPNPVKDVTVVALNSTVSSRSYHSTFTQEWWTCLQEKHLWRHQLLPKQHL